ncbi:RidA family protein [Phaeobacter sp.]|uniref:RidA family protein n=1 Tax=Phaeobacter sp. TaxID=1902409 RepID=UPI0025F24A3B|nr:RidA family protein [Phaeobacter sp.]
MSQNNTPTARLAALGLTLPPPPEPAAHYMPWLRSDDLIFLAGQTPKHGRELQFRGQVGQDLTIEEARKAAELCALRLLSALNDAAGGLENVEQVTKLTVFVNAAPGFADHPIVANGASDLIAHVLGPQGVHARSAVGASSLPGNAAVEVEAFARLKAQA